jgi:hypothetical protein
VANEIGLKLGAPSERRLEIAQRWKTKRDLLVMNSQVSEPISFEVRE